ncbi:hypothetical protein FOA43_003262 [Brettanomyces nanus]|uniref:Allantoate permease n=1 Tax=Eeniella nana TaxID=13502 RepID=A0A875S3G8_EENNA|nr:uncharacterized protein FOA43_003262 [Brettanomyces nanus]QPG75876.1 hypothetical protein FOA43_003262 [Brettanomyces nanus]
MEITEEIDASPNKNRQTSTSSRTYSISGSGELSSDSEIQLNLDSEKFLQDEKNENPFLKPKVADYYRDIYEKTKYECRGRFDPYFVWTKKEQDKLRRKLDIRVAFLACIMFVALQIDRGNLSQAVADNMLDDLGMSTNQYNTGSTIFYLCFLSAELPSQLISKKLGCDIWIPIQMVCWSLVSISQCGMRSATGFYITRALMGLLEGGFIPDEVIWLSYFYTGSELSIRLSWFWTTLSLTQVFSSLLAYAIFHMRGTGGLAGWSWLFLIEGLFTLVIGISSFFLMVPSAVQTKRPWNKKGYLNEREEKIVVNKILRDDPLKGTMMNRQGLTFRMFFDAISDYYLWPIYLIGLVAYIPAGTLDAYLTLVLKSMGYSTFNVNLLAIPYYILKVILLLSVTWFSERVKSIFNVALLQPLWAIPLIGVLRWWNGSFYEKWPTYIILIMILATPYIHAMMVSACSRNSQGVKTRTVSASLYNMFVQAGSIVASNIYRTNDKPFYHRGNTVLFGLAFAMIPILVGTKLFYVFTNRKREKVWNSMTSGERETYILTTKDSGNRRLNFRFAH